MERVLTADEIVEMACAIERAGLAFYEAGAARVKSPEVRTLLLALAEDEKGHVGRFERLLGPLEAGMRAFPPGDAWFESVRQLAPTLFYPDEAHRNDVVDSLVDERALLELALRFERAAVSFYREIAAAVAPEGRTFVAALVREEMAHAAGIERALEPYRAAE